MNSCRECPRGDGEPPSLLAQESRLPECPVGMIARILFREGITEEGKEVVSGVMKARILLRDALTARKAREEGKGQEKR